MSERPSVPPELLVERVAVRGRVDRDAADPLGELEAHALIVTRPGPRAALVVPAGATPKDGPSAGIGMVTSIVSTLTAIPVRADVAYGEDVESWRVHFSVGFVF